MKFLQRSILFIYLLLPIVVVAAERADTLNPGTPEVGDILVLNSPEGSTYQHIQFPQPNIIIKRAGVYNVDSVRGLKVEITEVTENKEGRLIVTLQPLEGKKFFRHWRWVKADYQGAIASGELKEVDK